MTKEITRIIKSYGEAAKPVFESKHAAKINAIAAIRRIEDELSSALDGERIRGLPNLAPEGVKQYVAARVRGSDTSPLSAKPTLCMGADGLLVMASYNASAEVDFVEAKDSDLIAEDLSSYMALLVRSLDAHVKASAATTSRYARIAELGCMVMECLTSRTRLAAESAHGHLGCSLCKPV